MKFRSGLALLLSLGVWTACGDDEEGTGGKAPPKEPAIVIDLVVDASRDGVADPADPADQDGEEAWDASRGAMFLPNLDDDDGDGKRDGDDAVVAAGADALDLVELSISACPDCPKGVTGLLELDPGGAANVRLYAVDATGGYRLIAGETGICNEKTKDCAPVASYALTTDEVRSGLRLALEGRDVVRSEQGWSGFLDLAYAIKDEDGAPLTSEQNPDGVDRARLRVASWQLFGNLSEFDRVWSDSGSAVFVAGVKAGAENAGVEHKRYSNYSDQWTQDFFQTGFFAITRRDEAGNTVAHGMRVANARPWSNYGASPISWLDKNYLGPDRATLVVYEDLGSGDTYDSHGNHDLIPPYENGSESYPLGRIIIGSGVLPETKAFYAAQKVQAPIMVVDSEWLWVGHIDEYLSYVPAATPRGWKLLVASPELAREMLLDAQAAGHGAAILHQGKYWYTESGTAPAAISVDEVLADPDLMAASQRAQVAIDTELGKLQAELGLADDEILEMPFLYTEFQYGNQRFQIAYQPGTVNALVMQDTIVIPKPFGPVIDGEDLFEADLRARLGGGQNELGSDGLGLDVFFADDWDLYHRLDGEVHCGTNPEGPIPASGLQWWETGR